MNSQPGFYLHHGNQLRGLAHAMGQQIATPVASNVLTTDCVLIPQPSMKRWLQIRIAEQSGIAANIEFEPPGQFIQRALAPWQNQNPDVLLNTERMQWRIFSALQDARLMNRAVFSPLRDYLQSNSQPRAWSLASELAHLYEQYQAWRRSWLLDWQRSPPADNWQAQLWNHISQGQSFRAQTLDAYFSTLETENCLRPFALPDRISVFACQNISPDVVRVLQSFGRWCEVHFYMHNPSEAFWGDTKRPQHRIELFSPLEDNALLNAWGTAGKDFVASMLLEQCPEWRGDLEYYVSHDSPSSLLQHIQSDILHRLPATIRFENFSKTQRDQSIQIHNCHSAIREVQVLRAQLLGIMQKNPELQWRDVAIMAPNLQPYLPFFDSVFNQHDGIYPSLPYTLSDPFDYLESPLAKLLFQLLGLAKSRLSSNEAYALLCNPFLANAQQLSGDDLQKIHHWFEQSGVRWGLNAAHRQRIDGVAQHEFTWQFALDRLLLGYASSCELLNDIAPCAELKGKDLRLLDVLFHNYHACEKLIQRLAAESTIDQWCALTSNILQHLVGTQLLRDEDQLAHQKLIEQLHCIRENAAHCNYSQAVSIEAFVLMLRDRTSSSLGQALLSGKITICQMVPMRLMPFKVLCVLGLNEADMPRQEPRSALNLISHAHDKQIGDRNTRDDDRFLMLQSLCSTENYLHLSYIGQSANDGSERPGSVLLTELVQCIGSYYPNRGFCLSQFEIKHPIHVFEQNNDPRAIALQSVSSKNELNIQWFAPVASQPINGTETEDRHITMHEFIRFWQKPTAYTAKQLGIRIPNYDVELNEQEPFGTAHSLEKYLLEQEILSHAVNSNTLDVEWFIKKLQAQAILAPGPAGVARFWDFYAPIQRAISHCLEQRIACVNWPIQLTIHRNTFAGNFLQYFRDGIIQFRFSEKPESRVKFDIDLRIQQLIASSCGLDLNFYSYTTRLNRVAPNADTQLAKSQLDTLANYFITGQTQLLCFDPQHSFEFYAEWLKNPTVCVNNWILQQLQKQDSATQSYRNLDHEFYFQGESFLHAMSGQHANAFQQQAIELCAIFMPNANE